MTVDIKVPALGESVTEAEVAKWYKQVGDAVDADEPLVELETDKVTLEVNAPAAGVLAEILAGEGAEVEVGAVLGRIDETGAGVAAAPSPHSEPAPAPESEPEPAAPPLSPPLSPAVRKLVAEHDLDPAAIEGTGKDGRLLKADVEAHLAAQAAAAEDRPPRPNPSPRRNRPRRPRRRHRSLLRSRRRRLNRARPASAKSGCACPACAGASPNGSRKPRTRRRC